MTRRGIPRPIGAAVTQLSESTAPATPISRVQRVWREVAGAGVAEHCEPRSERDGVVQVVCSSSVWAQELELLSVDLVARLNERIGTDLVRGLRCQAAGARRWRERG